MNLLKNYKVYDLVVIALMAALGIAVKIIVTPLAHMISGPLNMPGGALAGGFYMFWIVLSAGLIGKRGAATLTAFVQALMVIVVGSIGSHGIMSVITYTMPGIMIDLIFLVARRQIKTNIDFFIGGMIANMTGTFLTSMTFFRLPMITIVMVVASGMLSGGLGGLIAYATYKGVNQMSIMGHGDSDITQEEAPRKTIVEKKNSTVLQGVLSILLVIAVVVIIFLIRNPRNTDEELSWLNTADQLVISGDIEFSGPLNDFGELFEFEKITFENQEVYAIDTSILLTGLKQRSKEFTLYLKADDGFMVGIDGNTLFGTYIAYVPSEGWCYVSDKHPVNSRVKRIAGCTVVSKETLKDFNVIKDGKDHFYSYGEMELLMNEMLYVTDGVTSLDGIEIEVMKVKKVKAVSDFLEEGDLVMIATEDGDLIYEYGNAGYLEFSQDNIRYHSKDLLTTYQNVLGIMINPPSGSIKDHYGDVIHYLDQGEKVLSIFVDGFSYKQYEAITRDGDADFLDQLTSIVPATVGFKPVTNVGFTTMLTGVDPSVHGVHDRSYRIPEVPTVFDYCEALNIDHGLIEGDVRILQLETETFLNLDENNNGITDDEIHRYALEHIGDYDYVMVHYHSVDEFGHDFGPFSEETIGEIKLIDSYIEALVQNWDGKVIILADHGMHSTETAGDHGIFCVDDFVVPYGIFNGGLYEKE